MYKLGERVLVRGKLVKRNICPVVVAQVENAVLNHGITASSQKYDVEHFGCGKSKEGIIVGFRSIADSRVHYAKKSEVTGKNQYITKTTRKQVCLIATNLRGLIYAPFELVTSVKEIERLCREEALLEIEVDFDIEDEDLFDDDDLDFDDEDWDELDEIEL